MTPLSIAVIAVLFVACFLAIGKYDYEKKSH